MQALGRFTVKWTRAGIVQYVCWLSHYPHYYKCVNGIRGIRMEANGDRGVLVRDDYLSFPESSNTVLDPATHSTLLALPTPFFVEQYLGNPRGLSLGDKTVYKDDAPPPF